MRSILTITTFALASTCLASPTFAAEEQPWQKPGWEPIAESERQPPTPDEIAASTVPVRDYEGIRYLTGGLGVAERAWLEEHGADYPLFLQFSKGAHGTFVSSVEVTIRDGEEETIFEAVTDGPLIYIDLPAGRYQAGADYRGHHRDFALSVPQKGQTKRSINFQ